MLVQLLRTQVGSYWPLMQGHIAGSLPPIADEKYTDINHVLYSLLIGSMQCWLFTDKDQEKTKGFVLTTSILDPSNVRTLLVYNAILLDKEAKVVWEEEFNTLKMYAKDTGCHKIAAFVANKKIIDALTEQDFNTSFTYVSITL